MPPTEDSEAIEEAKQNCLEMCAGFEKLSDSALGDSWREWGEMLASGTESAGQTATMIGEASQDVVDGAESATVWGIVTGGPGAVGSLIVDGSTGTVEHGGNLVQIIAQLSEAAISYNDSFSSEADSQTLQDIAEACKEMCNNVHDQDKETLEKMAKLQEQLTELAAALEALKAEYDERVSELEERMDEDDASDAQDSAALEEIQKRLKDLEERVRELEEENSELRSYAEERKRESDQYENFEPEIQEAEERVKAGSGP